MQNDLKCGKLVTKDGYLLCLKCEHKIIQVRPNTMAKNLVVYCRWCRRETTVDIEQGQCFQSQGQ